MRLLRLVVTRAAFYAAAALFACFFAVPLVWLLFAPFDARANLAVRLPHPFTLANFGKVFANAFAVRALFQNSIIQAGGAMLLVTLLATLAAYALSRAPIRGKDMLSYGLVLFSSIVTGTAAMVPLFLLIYSLGLIDTQLGVILVFTGGLLPAAIFIMRDFVDSIPRSYEESALVSGASAWGMFRDIALPIVRPFVNVWGGFFVPFILLRSPANMPASVAIYSFYTEGGTPIITLTTAYSLLYTIPVLALYLFVNWRYGFRFFGGIKS
jgi:multiple sugar transport system permease protein